MRLLQYVNIKIPWLKLSMEKVIIHLADASKNKIK